MFQNIKLVLQGLSLVPDSFIINVYTTTEFFMYSTEQFEKDVQGLSDLIRMCDELEKENDRKTNAFIDQINGENAFFWRAN